ncbi:MAG: hypothetical protein FGM32_05240 [Candidatus Kapabacteria bacterium]|nr:hypothetical protein [Candidatus Kapabacteria bacterium]
MIRRGSTRVFLACLFAGALTACLPVPPEDAIDSGRIDGPGTFVLCEGVWRQDNATLCYIGDDGTRVNDVVSAVNAELRLGDTGSDLLVRGDTMWVVVSTSRSIEMFHRRTGMWLGRLRFDDLREPYKMAFVNDSVAVCTFLNDASIAEVNARRLAVRVARVDVGPAPEGIAVVGGRIYVANSGLGDLRKSEKGAGTVTVLEASDLSVLDTISDLPNVQSIVADPAKTRIWITYRSYPSQSDVLGGVVAYDLTQRRIVGRYQFRSVKGACIDPRSGTLYVMHAEGISAIRSAVVSTVMKRPNSETWYGLGFDARASRLLIGNARTYVTNGEIVIADTTGVVIRRHDVGINPSVIVAAD